jgi:WD40 repeat protein
MSSKVTSISFRTDSSSEKFPYMVSGSSDGRIYIWNLGGVNEPRKLVGVLDEAHSKYCNYCAIKYYNYNSNQYFIL